MKPWLKVVLLVLLMLALAAGSYFWATGMIDSNYAYRSPLKDAPPQPAESLGEPATDRLVFVLIDALRYDTSLKESVMPTLAHLRQVGASALMHSQPPSFSEPGYSTLLTGAWPAINDGPVFNLDYEEIPTFTQDNLFSAASRAGLETAISGYYWFEKLVPQGDVDHSSYTPGEDAAADREVVDAALVWLKATDTNLVLVHIDQVDYAGHHEGGAASPNWDAAAKRSDDLVAEILAAMDLENETIVVLSDHGQIDAGGHGGQDPVVLLEPFVIAGKGIKPGTYADIQMVDVAPTIAALFGANIPASAQGRVLEEMLNLSPQVSAAIPSVTRDQQSQLLTAYTASVSPNARIETPRGSLVSDYQAVIATIREHRLFSERIWHSAGAAIFLAVALTLLLRHKKRGVGGWLLTGLITALLFNLRYAVLDGKVYSLSSIIGVTELIVYIGVTTAVSFIIGWLVVALSRRIFRLSPAAAAEYTLWQGLTTVLVLFLPVLLSFVLNGALVTWTLPDYLTSYLALLCLIQILFVSGLTPILAGLTALISRVLATSSTRRNSHAQSQRQPIR